MVYDRLILMCYKLVGHGTVRRGILVKYFCIKLDVEKKILLHG